MLGNADSNNWDENRLALVFTGKLNSIVSPWPAHDIISAAESAIKGVFLLPHVGAVDFSSEKDWGRTFEGAANSKQLWFHSLPFIHDLAEAYAQTQEARYIRAALDLFCDYWKWVRGTGAAYDTAFADEHAVANRACVVAALIDRVSRGHEEVSPPTKALLVSALLQHGDWLCADAYYVENNHGVMMDRSLLQLAVQIREFDQKRYEHWATVATRRINRMLEVSFDRDGMNAENSPGYHVLNVALFSKITAFMRAHHIEGLGLDQAEHKISLAEKVSQLLVRSDGTVLPIGDTEIRTYPYIKPRFASFPFFDSGLAVIRTDQLDVTLKCGGAGFVHKHVDDTSITVRYLDEDLIVDSGLYNFDISDPLRRWFISPRAHSGFFTEESLNIRFADFTSLDEVARIVSFSETSEGVYTRAVCDMIPGVHIEREMWTLFPNVLVIRDSLKADRPQKWRQQFLLHPRLVAEIKADKVIATGAASRIHISQVGYSEGVLSIEKTLYSPLFMQKEENQCIVYSGEGESVELLTVIQLERGVKDEITAISRVAVDESGLDAEVTRNVRMSRAPAATVTCPAQLWEVASGKVQIVPGSNESQIVLNCSNSIGEHCYIQLFDGKFDSPAQVHSGLAQVPFGFSNARMEFSLKVEPKEGKVNVNLFFMQYNRSGERISNSSYPIKDAESDRRHLVTGRIEPGAETFKIAFRLADFTGKAVLSDVEVSFARQLPTMGS